MTGRAYLAEPAAPGMAAAAVKGAHWAEPDIEDAAAWLRRSFTDTALRTRLGMDGQAYAVQALGMDPLAAALEAAGIS